MAFQVDITEPALADIADYVRFIRDARKEPEAAERWFLGLLRAIDSLEHLPERCAASMYTALSIRAFIT